MTDLIDIMSPQPSRHRRQKNSDPWTGKEGDAARARGIRTLEQFRIVQVIEDEHRRSCKGIEGLSKIAMLADVEIELTARHLDILKAQDLICERRFGPLGRSAFYPVPS